jgi:hypothetical protein
MSRPSPELVRELRGALAAEREGLTRVRTARHEICTVLRAAKAEPGLTFIALATAITPATGSIAATTARRRRVAHALRCRLRECRRRRR